MSTWHICELEKKLNTSDWIISGRLDGDSYRVTQSWILSKNDKNIILDFEGFDENGHTFSFEKSFGCYVRQSREIALYLPKSKPRPSKPNSMKSWQAELNSFIKDINKLINTY